MPVYFKLVDENREVFKDYIDKLNVMTVGGELTILPNHTPLLTIVKDNGEIRVHKNKETFKYDIVGGVLVVKKKEISILAKNIIEK